MTDKHYNVYMLVSDTGIRIELTKPEPPTWTRDPAVVHEEAFADYSCTETPCVNPEDKNHTGYNQAVGEAITWLRDHFDDESKPCETCGATGTHKRGCQTAYNESNGER